MRIAQSVRKDMLHILQLISTRAFLTLLWTYSSRIHTGCPRNCKMHLVNLPSIRTFSPQDPLIVPTLIKMIIINQLLLHPLRDTICPHKRPLPIIAKHDIEVTAQQLTPLEILDALERPVAHAGPAFVLAIGIDSNPVMCEKIFPFLSLGKIEASVIVECGVVVQEPLDCLNISDALEL